MHAIFLYTTLFHYKLENYILYWLLSLTFTCCGRKEIKTHYITHTAPQHQKTSFSPFPSVSTNHVHFLSHKTSLGTHEIMQLNLLPHTKLHYTSYHHPFILCQLFSRSSVTLHVTWHDNSHSHNTSQGIISIYIFDRLVSHQSHVIGASIFLDTHTSFSACNCTGQNAPLFQFSMFRQTWFWLD